MPPLSRCSICAPCLRLSWQVAAERFAAQPHGQPPWSARSVKVDCQNITKGLIETPRSHAGCNAVLCRNSHDLAGMHGFNCRQNRVDHPQDCLDPIVERRDDNDPEADRVEILLILKTTVACDEDVEAPFDAAQQLAVFETGPPFSRDGRNIVT